MAQILNPNSFGQTVIRGFVDWHISRSGVLSAQVSAAQVTALTPGDPVKLDVAAVSNVPQIVAAAASDPKAFYVAFNEARTSYAAGDMCEIVGLFGPVIWQIAEATIAMGATVEQNANGNVQTLAAGKPRGIALLNGTATNPVPVMLTTINIAQS